MGHIKVENKCYNLHTKRSNHYIIMNLRILLATFILLTIGFLSYAQSTARKSFSIDTTHLLFSKFCGTIIKTTNKVLLMKDAILTIETDLAYIKKLKQNCKAPSQLTLLEAIIADTSQQHIDAIKVGRQLNKMLELNSIIASLLDQRHCWVTNNEPPIVECYITKCTFTPIGSFDAGFKEKKYFVGKYMFLKITE